MLGKLKGKIDGYIKGTLILDVGGVGYRIRVTPETLAKVNKASGEIELFIHLAVKENALDLYGFETQEELEFFEMLDAVSGIGPRSALAILGLADVRTLQSAIASGDTSYLTKVSGVGKKTAQKIIIELKDKLEAFETPSGEELRQDERDILDALEGLGYSLREARDALKRVPKEKEGMNERLKEALKLLSQHN